MYTLEQLRGFVAVAEEGNFGRAAERLRMTQPPLSRQIQKLEREIGVELFERTHRGVDLTAGGRVFLDEARRLLGLAEAAPLRARSVSRGAAGAVRIGFTAMTAISVLGGWIRAAGQHLPDVDLVLSEAVSREQVAALLAGDLDIGVARGVPRSDLLGVRLVHAESLVLAVRSDHPLATSGREPEIAEIAEHDLITYSPVEARYLHELVVAVFQHQASRPTTSSRSTRSPACCRWSTPVWEPRSCPSPRPSSSVRAWCTSPVADITPRTVQAHAVWRLDNANPAVSALLRLVLPSRPPA
ncbi:LysR family transcriptional regulator [Georgenia sp. SUBG003]|uniref:LysR family transcriptional regulator n=1 Tax=Georgenia sp. SUBG003 TaxID=1497974 RepID=UPI000A486043